MRLRDKKEPQSQVCRLDEDEAFVSDRRIRVFIILLSHPTHAEELVKRVTAAGIGVILIYIRR